MINIALFGPPGAGKGTQSKLLLEKYNLAYLATGDILRKEIAGDTDLGRKAKDIISKGELVSDELIVQIIERYILENQDASGFLFDGFPRTFVQAYILEGLLLKLNTSLNCMISLEVPHDELVIRMLERGKTSNRSDDSIEIINHRLEEYENKTAPVAGFYMEKGIYTAINGVGSMESVFNSINTVVEQTIKKVWVNIVVHGYPGAGKGTQAAKLAKKYNLVYISTGEMMRDEVKNKTEIGEKIKSFIEIGAIVPDEIAIRMIESKIKTNPDSNGFIFKGFPRTLVQAYILDGMLRKLNASVTHVINLEVSMLEAIKRLSARAKTSGARSYDMNIDVIVQRLEEFEVITSQVAGYYEKQQKYSSINGNGEIDEVYARLEPIVEKAIKQIR